MKLDLTQLNLLAGNSPDFKNQILQLLLIQTKEVSNALKEGKEMTNLNYLADTAHKFKSSANLISPQVYLHFMELEMKARAGENEALLPQMIDLGIVYCDQLEKKLREELASAQ